MRKYFLILAFALVLCISFTGCNSSDYSKASKLEKAKDYTAAATIYESLGDYKDSSERLTDCKAMIDAIAKYETAKSTAEQKNQKLDDAVSVARAIIDEGKTALDETLIPALETAISEALASKKDIPDMPDTEEDIINTSNQINAVNYDSVLSNLSEKQSALEKSIKQYALVDNPSEAYIIQCLSRVANVVDIAAATEDNDPNGKLGKQGGYTAQVYFSSDLIEQSGVYGTTLLEKGTAGGGSIEVYTTVDYAKNRNTYLSAFDGGILSNGSHTVIGTVVVRISDKLTASQQKELEKNVIASLTQVDE